MGEGNLNADVSDVGGTDPVKKDDALLASLAIFTSTFKFCFALDEYVRYRPKRGVLKKWLAKNKWSAKCKQINKQRVLETEFSVPTSCKFSTEDWAEVGFALLGCHDGGMFKSKQSERCP